MSTALAATSSHQLSTGATFDTSILAGTRTASTIRMYTRDFKAYGEFAGSFDSAMKPETLAQWRTHLANETQMSPRTINRMLSACKSIVAEAASQGYVSHDTAEAFKRVKGVKVAALKDRTKPNAKVWLSPEQMAALCEAPDTSTLAGKMHKALLLSLSGVGMRVAEAVNMRFSDISLETDGERVGYVVKIAGKNKAEATDRSISVKAYNAICEWLEARERETGVKSEFIFTGTRGNGGSREASSQPIHTVSAWEIVKRYAKAADLDMHNVKPHDFRRFVAYRMGKKHGIKAAQTQLGHANIATTAGYMPDDPVLGGTDDLF